MPRGMTLRAALAAAEWRGEDVALAVVEDVPAEPRVGHRHVAAARHGSAAERQTLGRRAGELVVVCLSRGGGGHSGKLAV